MSTARKRTANKHSMLREWRKKAYAAINITWLQIRPDLKFEDKGTIREERLAWVASFLGLKKLDSTMDLSDEQLGLVLDEMRKRSGTRTFITAAQSLDIHKRQAELVAAGKLKVIELLPKREGNVVNLAQFKKQHYASNEQKYTLIKIINHLGWTDEATRDFLVKRKFGESIEKLAFKKANRLTMILLNSAADKELRRVLPKGEKITRQMTADYIPMLKKKLQIGD